MKRPWNWVLGEPGSGAGPARALGLLSSRPVVAAMAEVHEALVGGKGARINAERGKFDADGNQIEDVKNEPGDYLTLGYVVTVDEDEWTVEREPGWEGEPSAISVADALGAEADHGFCETMVQAKCLLDRIGGQLFLRPYMREGQVVGVLAHYEHIGGREPDASLSEPIELPGESGPQPEGVTESSLGPPEGEGEEGADSPATSPEEMHAELEAERV